LFHAALMADTAADDSAASAAVERSPRARMRRASRLSVRQDAPLEGAGSVTPTTGHEQEFTDVESDCKRGRSNEVAVGDRSAATVGTDRQVADDPYERASKRLKGMAEALRRRADEVFPAPEAGYPPPNGSALLDELTDELLVVASDAVDAAAAAYRASIEGLGLPAFSGKAQLRLLAWLVADARGADKLLDKPEAEKVGKRLQRQAQTVREALAAASAAAEADRSRAREEGADEARLAGVLPPPYYRLSRR